jgi:hypothetical protein
MIRRILLGLLVVFVGIQLVPVERTNPPDTAPIDAPPPVRAILERSCFDCHSNGTRWPWYSYVAPASWLVAKDVREGREELNFSTWDQYDARRAAHKIGEVREEIDEGAMPLPNYLRIHPEARLSDEDVAVLTAWSLANGDSEHGEESEHAAESAE